MAPKRPPLSQISNNPRRKGHELSSYQRGIIAGQRDGGASIGKIAKQHNLSKSTVQTTLNRDAVRQQGKSLPRSGRPPKWTERDARAVKRVVKRVPGAGYARIREETGLEFSNKTLKSILRWAGAR